MLNIKFMRTTTWLQRARFAPRKGVPVSPEHPGWWILHQGSWSLGALNLIRLMPMGRLDDMRGLGVVSLPNFDE